MAKVLIEPIHTQTSGGYSAELNAIDPTAHDCIVGVIDTPGEGKKAVNWDLGGMCRDNDPSCNLDTHADEIADVFDTAKILGAKN